MVIYLNDIAIDSRNEGEIMVNVDAFFKERRVPAADQPEGTYYDKMIYRVDNQYVTDRYTTPDEFIRIAKALDDRYLPLDDKYALQEFLIPALTNHYNKAPFPSPLWRWWTPMGVKPGDSGSRYISKDPGNLLKAGSDDNIYLAPIMEISTTQETIDE